MATFRVCLQNLSAYNDGRLVFEWLDLPLPEDEIEQARRRVLRAGGGEELMLADSEGFPFKVGEYDSLDSLNNWAEALENANDPEMVAAYLANMDHGVDDDPKSVIEDAEERFIGKFESRADFAEEYVGQSIDVPEALQYYIDWDRMGRDCLMDGYFESNDHYFYNH